MARARADTIKNIEPRAITADEERCEKSSISPSYSSPGLGATSAEIARAPSGSPALLFDQSVASVVYFIIQLFSEERERSESN